ncbi:vinculin family domain-containing protein [Ditylenchus destructor]|nr:vinculin family domain-containing protein [Ditylenchus destructor]
MSTGVLPKAVERYTERVITPESLKTAALEWLADAQGKPGALGEKSLRKIVDYSEKIAARSLPEDQNAIRSLIGEISSLLDSICDLRSQGRYDSQGQAQRCAQALRELVETKESVGLRDTSLSSIPYETLEAAKKKIQLNF